jgi:murein DD-endopeptidase MepM/ murein hydrolase activator NlpD
MRNRETMMKQDSLHRFCHAALLLTLVLPIAHGQTSQTTATGQAAAGGAKAAQRRAAAGVVHDCGNGVALRLTAATALQGGLLEASVVGTASDLKGEWAGKPLPFWADAKDVEHALLGVDLEREPGKYDLSISEQLAGGESLTCSASVDVAAGKFAVESLTVAPGFVELSPEDRARADKESQRVHEIYATVTPERLWSGEFRFPLAGKITGHNFGKRRVLNGKPSAPHTGLDIPAAAGTPIHASQSGRVVLADNLFFSGNTVIVDHGLGLYTFYCHMKTIGVAVGDEVKAGAILGEVGATGRVTGPHLHWSLVVNGARVNPLGILRLSLQ